MSKEQITPTKLKEELSHLLWEYKQGGIGQTLAIKEIVEAVSKYGLSTPAPSEKQMQRTIDEQYKTIEGSKGLSEQEIREEDCPECGGSGIANRYRY